MPKVQLLPGTAGVFSFYCPGCGKPHTVFTKDEGFPHPVWSFNGDLEHPTFNPSVAVTNTTPEGEKMCHSFIRNGVIEYLSDCDHALAGKLVEMEEVNDG